jgi:hypothetical protein
MKDKIKQNILNNVEMYNVNDNKFNIFIIDLLNVNKKTVGILNEKETLLFRAYIGLLTDGNLYEINKIASYYNLSLKRVSESIAMAKTKINIMVQDRVESTHINCFDLNDEIYKYKEFYITEIGLSSLESNIFIRMGICKVKELVNCKYMDISKISGYHFNSIINKIHSLRLCFEDELKITNKDLNENLIKKILNTNVEDEFNNYITNVLKVNKIYKLIDIYHLDNKDLNNLNGITVSILEEILIHFDKYQLPINLSLDNYLINYNDIIEKLSLSNRSYNALKRNNINYIKDLVKLNKKTILNYSWMNETCLEEIINALNKNGLYFENELETLNNNEDLLRIKK